MKKSLQFNFWTVQTLGWGIFTLTNLGITAAQEGFTPYVLLTVPFVFLFGMVITGFYRWYIRRRNWHKKSLGSILVRVLWSVPIVALLFALLALLSGELLGRWVGVEGNFSPESLIVNWLSSCIIMFGWAGLYFAYHFFIRYREAEVQRWRVQAVLHESQLNALKSQVNPHFLFNSLNSLSALIDIDPERAKRFVDDLSSSYRYLLQANEHPLVPLSTEIGFLNSYFNLLKTRHGDGVQLEIRLPEGFPDPQLPPLTLQLLVENAVKHNIVSVQKPLNIKIFTENTDWLVISNNVQKKSTQVLSTKTGLANITEKYRLLGSPSVEIIQTPDEFRVRVPLL